MARLPRDAYNSKPYANRRPNVHNTLLWLLALAALLTYAGGYTARYLARGSVATTEVTRGAVSRSVTFDGVAVREETVYHAQAAGVVVPVVADGERARKGGEICAVQSAAAAGIEDEMARIDESILKQDAAGASLFEADIAAADARVRHAAEEAAFGLAEGRIAELYQLKDKVTAQLDARRQLLRIGATGDARGLVTERAIFESRLSAARRPVTALAAGLVSYATDGFEEALTPERLDSLGADVARFYTAEGTLRRVSDAGAGEAVCRVVTSNEWYIVGFVEDAKAAVEWLSEWQPGRAVAVNALHGGGQAALNTRLRSIRAEGGGAVVTLLVEQDLDAFIDARGLRLTIDDEQAEGLKIPNGAVAEKTLLSFPAEYVTLEKSQEYVTKRVNGKNERVVITVTERSGDKATAYVIQDYNNLKFGDEIVAPNGAAMRVTGAETITGVYVANTGAPTFREVSFEGGSLVGDLYTVLDPAHNAKLKPYDRIVVDARHFDDKALVY